MAAVRLPRARISARHPSGGTLPELTEMRKLERNSTNVVNVNNEEKLIKEWLRATKPYTNNFYFQGSRVSNEKKIFYYKQFEAEY